MNYLYGRLVMKLFDRRTEGWDKAEEAHARYDAGEWPSEGWGQAYEDMLDSCIGYVADAYHVTPKEVYSNYTAYYNEQMNWH